MTMKWISAKEQLPEKPMRTVIRKVDNVDRAEFVVRDYLDHVGWWYSKDVQVTHWIPLPDFE